MQGMKEIYLDHAATTPLHPEVVEAMLPFLREVHGNPSSMHRFGRRARQAVDEARLAVASSLHAEPGEIIFTSGGTEADNFALIGVALANRARGNHIITSKVEHHAVLDTCGHLEKMGFEITYLPVDKTGMVDTQQLVQAIRDETILISIMYGNNEVGTMQPVEEIGDIARSRGILFHSDCVQAFGSLPLDVRALPVDLLSVSAHKINGPKGAGALYVSRGVNVNPYLFGGSQEKKRRAGTENVPGIVGFGKAAEIAAGHLMEKRDTCEKLRGIMTDVWRESELFYTVNGHPTRRLSHILNVSFPGADTETLLMNLDLAGIAASSGSACTSGSLERSHVLIAMNLDEQVLNGAIRFSFGMGNTEEQVRQAAKKTEQIVKRLQQK